MVPTYPEFSCEVVRDGVIAREDGKPDQPIGVAVVGETMIHGRKARSVLGIDRSTETLLRNDDAIIEAAKPGLREAFRELVTSLEP